MSNSNIFKTKLMITLAVVLSSLAVLFSGSSASAVGYASNINVTDLYNLSNQQRSNAGLASLSLNSKLSSAAYAKANHMIANNYWAHVAPDGSTPWTFILGSGYSYVTAGENLAKDFSTSSGVTTGWMNSPSHRANLLNTSYKEVGYAVVNGILLGGETTLVVAMYGDPIISAPAPVVVAPVVATPAPTTVIPAPVSTTPTTTQTVTQTQSAPVTTTETQNTASVTETTVTTTQPTSAVVSPTKTSSKKSVKATPASKTTTSRTASPLTVIVESIKKIFKTVANFISSLVPVKEVSTVASHMLVKVAN